MRQHQRRPMRQHETARNQAAPKARNIIARGKREQSECVAPGYNHQNRHQGLKGRNIITPFQGWARFKNYVPRGDALRACPWLSYVAPLALKAQSVRSALKQSEIGAKSTK